MTMTMTGSARALTPPAAGVRLWGELICWSCSGVSIRFRDLLSALDDAGLDTSVARELAPRHAFTRACKKLSDSRIIRPLSEDANAIRFQFTSERRDGGQFRYDLEAVLTLDKAGGEVSCDRADLAVLAQAAVDECLAARSGGDVTRVIQKLFDREADLFPIRPNGGVYFVPREHASFVDRIDRFVRGLGGELRRFPVPEGTDHGDRSVRDAVAAGIEALIEGHHNAIDGFGEDTREGTVERAAERIKQTRFKVRAYSEYLAEQRERLERDLDRASMRLREKVDAIHESA